MSAPPRGYTEPRRFNRADSQRFTRTDSKRFSQAVPKRFDRTDADTEALRVSAGRDYAQLAVGIIAAFLSIASTAYYFEHHLILGYQDSFSHLELSRRFVVGMSPGIAQLGGVWLPLPQVLQALFSWNYTLYSTGLAGSIVSMVSYVAVTILLYRIIRVFSGDRKWPAVAGALVFAVNANVLYHQSTSMDELPFYALTTAAVYFLVKWGATRDPTQVLAAGIASLLAMLCRYEGWFLAVVYVLCVGLMGWRLRYSWRDIRGLTLIFAIFGVGVSAGGWVLYNFLIFKNPLNFENGPQSSAAQMAEKHNQIINIGNWPLTLKAYYTMLASDLGIAALALGAIGLVVFIFAERFSARSLPVFALISVVPFYIYTLEAGAEPISVPGEAGLLNYRFGLIVAIPIAILTGYLIAKMPRGFAPAVAVLVILGLTGLSAQAFRTHQVVLATEAGQDLYAQRYQIQAADFLEKTTGLVLIDTVQNERVDFPVVDRTIYDGTKESGRNQWVSVLQDPPAFGVKVIVMRLPNPAEPLDAVYGALNGSPLLKKDYVLVFRSSAYVIYEARRGAPSPAAHA